MAKSVKSSSACCRALSRPRDCQSKDLLQHEALREVVGRSVYLHGRRWLRKIKCFATGRTPRRNASPLTEPLSRTFSAIGHRHLGPEYSMSTIECAVFSASNLRTLRPTDPPRPTATHYQQARISVLSLSFPFLFFPVPLPLGPFSTAPRTTS